MAFLISTFQLQQFPRYQENPKFTLGAPAPSGRPQRNIFRIQSAHFTSNGVFNFNVLTRVVSEIFGVSNLHYGPCVPWTPPSGNNMYPKLVLYHNCVCNFNFLAVVVSEILGRPNFTLGGPAPPERPQRKNFVPRASTFPYLSVFLFQLSSSSSFRDIRGSQFYIEGTASPNAPQRKKFDIRPNICLYYCNVSASQLH